MAKVNIQVSGGAVQVEVGPHSSEYVVLLNEVAAELKSGKTEANAIANRIARKSGTKYAQAYVFVYCTQRILAGEDVPESWTLWCGDYAYVVFNKRAIRSVWMFPTGAVLSFLLLLELMREGGGYEARVVSMFVALMVIGTLYNVPVATWKWLKARSAKLAPVPDDIRATLSITEPV